MRAWIMMGVGAIVLASLPLTGGAWGASMEEIGKEMTTAARRPMSRIAVWAPQVFSESKGVQVTDLCVSGDSLRTKGGSEPGRDMGKVAAGNAYRILVVSYDPVGDMTILYSREMSLPKCQ